MKIEIELSEENEAADSPYWLIINPKQNLRTDRAACHRIASMVTGPFFSRKSAEDYLKARRYNFGPNALVYCHSGYYSNEYKEAIRKAEACAKGQ